MSRTYAHTPERIRVMRESHIETHRHDIAGRWGLADYCTIDEHLAPGWRLADGRRALCFRELPIYAGGGDHRRGVAVVEKRAAVRDALIAAAREYNTYGEVDDPAMPDPDVWRVCPSC